LLFLLNKIPDNADVVFIALNPTADAIHNQALFSRDEAFWNILISADFLDVTIKHIPLKNRVNIVCEEFLYTKNKMRIGIADLLPNTVETDSKKVKVEKNNVRELFELNPQLKNAKKIVLLGEKVVNGFHLYFPSLKNWREIEIIDGTRDYGEIGTITIDNMVVRCYAMPFPTNNNIPEKPKFYSRILL